MISTMSSMVSEIPSMVSEIPSMTRPRPRPRPRVWDDITFTLGYGLNLVLWDC